MNIEYYIDLLEKYFNLTMPEEIVSGIVITSIVQDTLHIPYNIVIKDEVSYIEIDNLHVKFSKEEKIKLLGWRRKISKSIYSKGWFSILSLGSLCNNALDKHTVDKLKIIYDLF